MNNVIDLKGSKEAPRAARSSMETLIISIDQINQWHIPVCQRPTRVNHKVMGAAEEIKKTETISGIITLGKIGRASTIYVVDGLHRLEGFRLSGREEAIADVRIVHFDTMAELANEFIQLNSSLSRIGPDDILRAMELMSHPLQRIRAECAFVGYDQIRRKGNTSPMVGMSQLLRCWMGSAKETPVSNSGNATAAGIALAMDEQSADLLIKFLHLCETAWGREPTFYKLWGALNLTMTMWLYRRLVVEELRSGKRHIKLNDPGFRQCLMALSADTHYLDFLQGRFMSERDRAPCYTHLRRIFLKRLASEGHAKPMLPNPPWAS